MISQSVLLWSAWAGMSALSWGAGEIRCGSDTVSIWRCFSGSPNRCEDRLLNRHSLHCLYSTEWQVHSIHFGLHDWTPSRSYSYTIGSLWCRIRWSPRGGPISYCSWWVSTVPTYILLQGNITPLGAAASGGHIQLVEKLITKWHASINQQDIVWWSYNQSTCTCIRVLCIHRVAAHLSSWHANRVTLTWPGSSFSTRLMQALLPRYCYHTCVYRTTSTNLRTLGILPSVLRFGYESF